MRRAPAHRCLPSTTSSVSKSSRDRRARCSDATAPPARSRSSPASLQDEFDSLVRVRFGEYGKQYYEGMLNTPITDSVALRINGVYNKSDGWLKDAATGEDLVPEENWAGRAALRWELSDKTSATLSWDHDDLDQLARPAIGLVAGAVRPDASPVPGRPGRPTSIPARPRSTTTWSATRNRASSTRLTLFVDHSFGWADFRSSTSWRQFDTVNREDEDGTNLIGVYFDTANIERQRELLSGVQVLRSDRPDRLGGRRQLLQREGRPGQRHSHLHRRHRHARREPRYLGRRGPAVPAVRRHQQRSSSRSASRSACSACRGAKRCTTTATSRRYAAFGDVIWHVNDRTNLTVGLRYTRDTKEFTWTNGPHETPELDQMVAGLQQAGFFDADPDPAGGLSLLGHHLRGGHAGEWRHEEGHLGRREPALSCSTTRSPRTS